MGTRSFAVDWKMRLRTMMAEFLFEIGLEEVPARMIAGAQAELQRRVVAMLERERLVAIGRRERRAFRRRGGWRFG